MLDEVDEDELKLAASGRTIPLRRTPCSSITTWV